MSNNPLDILRQSSLEIHDDDGEKLSPRAPKEKNHNKNNNRIKNNIKNENNNNSLDILKLSSNDNINEENNHKKKKKKKDKKKNTLDILKQSSMELDNKNENPLDKKDALSILKNSAIEDDRNKNKDKKQTLDILRQSSLDLDQNQNDKNKNAINILKQASLDLDNDNNKKNNALDILKEAAEESSNNNIQEPKEEEEQQQQQQEQEIEKPDIKDKVLEFPAREVNISDQEQSEYDDDDDDDDLDLFNEYKISDIDLRKNRIESSKRNQKELSYQKQRNHTKKMGFLHFQLSISNNPSDIHPLLYCILKNDYNGFLKIFEEELENRDSRDYYDEYDEDFLNKNKNKNKKKNKNQNNNSNNDIDIVVDLDYIPALVQDHYTGITAIHLVSILGRIKMLKKLMSSWRNIYIKELHSSIRILLRRRLSFLDRIELKLKTTRSRKERNLIYKTIENYEQWIIEEIIGLMRGFELRCERTWKRVLSIKDKNGRTPLHYAASNDKLQESSDILKLLFHIGRGQLNNNFYNLLLTLNKDLLEKLIDHTNAPSKFDSNYNYISLTDILHNNGGYEYNKDSIFQHERVNINLNNNNDNIEEKILFQYITGTSFNHPNEPLSANDIYKNNNTLNFSLNNNNTLDNTDIYNSSNQNNTWWNKSPNKNKLLYSSYEYDIFNDEEKDNNNKKNDDEDERKNDKSKIDTLLPWFYRVFRGSIKKWGEIRGETLYRSLNSFFDICDDDGIGLISVELFQKSLQKILGLSIRYTTLEYIGNEFPGHLKRKHKKKKKRHRKKYKKKKKRHRRRRRRRSRSSDYSSDSDTSSSDDDNDSDDDEIYIDYESLIDALVDEEIDTLNDDNELKGDDEYESDKSDDNDEDDENNNENHNFQNDKNLIHNNNSDDDDDDDDENNEKTIDEGLRENEIDELYGLSTLEKKKRREKKKKREKIEYQRAEERRKLLQTESIKIKDNHEGYVNIKYIIRERKNILNKQDIKGYGAIHYASVRTNSYFLRLLIKYGANQTIHSYDGDTALKLCPSNTCRHILTKKVIGYLDQLADTGISRSFHETHLPFAQASYFDDRPYLYLPSSEYKSKFSSSLDFHDLNNNNNHNNSIKAEEKISFSHTVTLSKKNSSYNKKEILSRTSYESYNKEKNEKNKKNDYNSNQSIWNEILLDRHINPFEPLGVQSGKAPIHIAARAGLVDIMKNYLGIEEKYDNKNKNNNKKKKIYNINIYDDELIDISDSSGWTALHHCVYLGGKERYQIAMMLLESSANVNSLTLSNKTPLHLAAEGGSMTSQYNLSSIINNENNYIDQNDNNNNSNNNSNDDIYHDSTLDEILGKTKRSNNYNKNIYDIAESKNDLINEASRTIDEEWYSKNKAIINLLIKFGADIEAKDNKGMTPLLIAADCGMYECVYILLELGANLYARNLQGLNALELASIKKHRRCIQLLIQLDSDFQRFEKISSSIYGASLSKTYHTIWLSSAKGDTKGIQSCITQANQERAYITDLYEKNNTISDQINMPSIASSNLPSPDILYENYPWFCASIDDRTPIHQLTPLHTAVISDTNLFSIFNKNKNKDQIKINNRYRHKVSIKQESKLSTQKSIHTINFLLDNYAFVDSLDCHCRTPLMLSCIIGNQQIAGTLLNRGADINSTDLGGNTALHYAYAFGNMEIVTFLERNGAKLHIKNLNNHKPKDIIGKGRNLINIKLPKKLKKKLIKNFDLDNDKKESK